MQPSIFTKIINGEVPCHKIYEDDFAMAIMDIHPAQTGQVVVFSKSQVDHFMDLPDTEYTAFMMVVKKVATKLRKLYPEARIGVQIEGFQVPHAHAVLLPVHSPDEFRAYGDEGEPDHEQLAELAKKLQITG